MSLLADGYLNDGFDELRGLGPSNSHQLLERHGWVRSQHLSAVISGGAITLHISHKGRVRLSELAQQFKTGRDSSGRSATS